MEATLGYVLEEADFASACLLLVCCVIDIARFSLHTMYEESE